MQLSQGALNLLSTCPRKFQHVYLDQLSIPMPLEQQERLAWGKWFHLLMQQQVIGIPLENGTDELISPVEQPIRQAADRFINATPTLFQSALHATRQSEHRRTLHYQGHLLTVIYDLLILEPVQAQILDWKTYPRPNQSDRLIENWQTQLYLFVLAQTGHYEPEQISMTYWFIDRDTSPQCLRLDYNRLWYQQTQQKLSELLAQLDRWLGDYQQNKALPQTGKTAGHCEQCTFSHRCHWETAETGMTNSNGSNLSDIGELSL